ncbi:MAG: helix-turn-helix domain-containing protein [Alistipes sp.]|nr:helix-turn-helix domain-containing protein [Alistipes sp.]
MITIEDNYTLEKIKQLCGAKGWSVYKLAKESKIPYSSLNNIFIRNTQPTIPTLAKICQGLGLSVSEFFQDGFPEDYYFRYDTLTEDENDLLKTYQSIDANDKKILLAFAHGLAKKL